MSGVPTGSLLVMFLMVLPENAEPSLRLLDNNLYPVCLQPHKVDDSPTVALVLTPDQALEPKAAVLSPHPLVGTSVPSITKWMGSFPVET